MNVAYPSPRQALPWQILARGLAGLFIAFLFTLFGQAAHAAAPAANSIISNQATATYFNSADPGAQKQNVSSNQVLTKVTQVYAVTLATDGARTATPGSQVYFPHTLTNTGNGTDSFDLTAISAATPFTLSNVQIFADNGSGQPTGAAITATPELAAGATFKFVVSAVVPTSATANQANAMAVKAASTHDATKSATNTDTTTVTVYANIDLSKSLVGANSGAPGAATQYQYRIEYRNTGNQDATTVAIADVLPAGMTYVPNSVKWNGSSATITDNGAAVGSPATIKVVTATSAGRTTVTSTISRVALNTSGYITFNVTINSGTAPGVLQNTATVDYNNGNIQHAVNTSNAVDFTVTQSADLTLTTTAVATADPGQTVLFTNKVTNTGTGLDTFNITLANSNFPAGTTFTLLKSDGATTLTDTDGDGTVDTGPLAAGAEYNVILKAVLPNSAGGNNSGNGWTIDKTATSKFDPSKSKTVTDKLNTITLNKVDLAHVSTGTGTNVGVGPGPEAAAQQTPTVNPGASTTFTLYVNNTGTSSDSYTLTASTGALGTTTLPAGWTVEFKAATGSGGAVCSSTGTSLTSTGIVNAGASFPVCAVVSVPAGFVAGQQDLNFFAASSTSGKSDGVHDAVIVAAVRALSLTPNYNGQTYPGGTYTYSHVLRNNGNVDEAVTVSSALVSSLGHTLTNSDSNWTATVYVSTDSTFGNADDKLVTSADLTGLLPTGLARGQQVWLFVKVQAPQGASAGAVNTTTLKVLTTNGSYVTAEPAVVTAIDATTVISGNLFLDKKQALDTGCLGNVGAATFSSTQLNAKPGDCVLYQITVTNIGAADAFNVKVNDTAPPFTTFSATAPVTATGNTVVMAGDGRSFQVNVGTDNDATKGGTLSPNQSAVITFGVKIDQ